jgi:hypothetical protein
MLILVISFVFFILQTILPDNNLVTLFYLRILNIIIKTMLNGLFKRKEKKFCLLCAKSFYLRNFFKTRMVIRIREETKNFLLFLKPCMACIGVVFVTFVRFSYRTGF